LPLLLVQISYFIIIFLLLNIFVFLLTFLLSFPKYLNFLLI